VDANAIIDDDVKGAICGRLTYENGLPHEAEGFGAEEVRHEEDECGCQARGDGRVEAVKGFT
jgi:hypothetical protein